MGDLSQAIGDDLWAIVFGVIIGWHMQSASASSVEQLGDILAFVLLSFAALSLGVWVIGRYRGDDDE